MKTKIILLLAIASAKAAVLPTSPEIVKISDGKVITPELVAVAKTTSENAAASTLTEPTLDKSIPAQSAPVPIASKSTPTPTAPLQPDSKVLAAASVTEITVKSTASPIAPPSEIKTDSAIKDHEKELPKKVIAEKVSESTSKDAVTDKHPSLKSVNGPTAFSFVDDVPFILHEYDELEGFAGDFDDDNFGDDKNDDSIHNYFGY